MSRSCAHSEKSLKLESIDRHVLIPVERARLDHKHKSVILDGLFGRDLSSYPVFTGLPLSIGSIARDVGLLVTGAGLGLGILGAWISVRTYLIR